MGTGLEEARGLGHVFDHLVEEHDIVATGEVHGAVEGNFTDVKSLCACCAYGLGVGFDTGDIPAESAETHELVPTTAAHIQEGAIFPGGNMANRPGQGCGAKGKTFQEATEDAIQNSGSSRVVAIGVGPIATAGAIVQQTRDGVATST
jgi:hypothetical protein